MKEYFKNTNNTKSFLRYVTVDFTCLNSLDYLSDYLLFLRKQRDQNVWIWPFLTLNTLKVKLWKLRWCIVVALSFLVLSFRNNNNDINGYTIKHLFSERYWIHKAYSVYQNSILNARVLPPSLKHNMIKDESWGLMKKALWPWELKTQLLSKAPKYT